MRGDQFGKKASKDIIIARVVAALALLAGISAATLLRGSPSDILLAVSFAVVGAAAAIDGGVRKRIQVWPFFDAVINWRSVEDKCQEEKN